jgi:amino acid transporter
MTRTRSPRPAALLVLIVGLAIVALYFVLRALQIGKIGQPTDIGGGAIVLLGYIVTIGGLEWVITDMIRGRS